MNRYPHRHTASESKTTVQPLVVWKVYALPEEECLDEEINTTNKQASVVIKPLWQKLE